MMAVPAVAQLAPCVPALQLRRHAFTSVRPARLTLRGLRQRVPAAPRAQQGEDIGGVGISVAAAGLISNPIVLLSEWTLFQTGSGLPPGPGGAYGAAEGVSYLVIVGLVAWSLYSKARTGSGLPAGPAGLLGAAEGFSYLSLALGIVVAGLQAFK